MGFEQGVDMRLGRAHRAAHERVDGQAAQRKTHAVLFDLALGPVGRNGGHLEASAAHVTDQTVRPPETGQHAHGGEAGFLETAQEMRNDAGHRLDLGQKAAAIGGSPDRFGRQDVDLSDTHGGGDGHEPAYGGQSLTHRVLRQQAGLFEVARQAAEGLFVEAREGGPRQAIVDHQP